MKKISIGRNPDNTIVIDSTYQTVSGYHATVYFDGHNYVFEDHSSNGSYVNGIKIYHTQTTISPNDTILLSKQYRLDNKLIFSSPNNTVLDNSSPYSRPTEMFSSDGNQHVAPQHSEPSNLHSFNFGAFAFGWLWGVCNSVYIALLTLIPAINLIMCIILGVKGNEWAWEKQRNNTSPENFVQTQKKWTIAGIIVFAVTAAISLISFLVLMSF